MALTDEERLILWRQFVEVHGESQEAYDNSVRAIAAAGVAVTVSLATALKGISAVGLAAIALFLASLTLNLVSYVTTQRDMTLRLSDLREGRDDAGVGNGWTLATSLLNTFAGVGVVVGGALLAWFVAAKA
jgi:hypothetical protein